MSSYFTSAGTSRYTSPDLPDDLSAWPELERAADELRRLEREYQADAAAEEQARTAIEDETASTRAKIIEAKRAGQKKLPGSEGIEKAQAAYERAKLEREAADEARRLAAVALVEVVQANRETWLPSAEEAVDRARASEAEALVDYLDAVEATTRASQTATWIGRFPEYARIKPISPPLAHADRRGDPLPWADVAYALRVRAGLDAPPARTMKEHVEAAGLTPAAVIGGPVEGEAA